MSSSTFSKSGSNHFSSNSPKVTGRSWEELRKEARHLENEIDGRLIELSKLGTSLRTSPSTPFHAGDPSKVPLLSDEDSSSSSLSLEDDFSRLTQGIDGLLSKLSAVNLSLGDYTERHPPSAASHHTLQRHGEILKDYRQEYMQTRENISALIKRHDLLYSGSSSKSDLPSSNRMDALLRESEHVRHSERLIDDQISIAIEAREALANQRQTFKAIQTKLNDISNRFPMINNLVQKINLRKRRDAIILAVVVGLCLTFFLWWLF